MIALLNLILVIVRQLLNRADYLQQQLSQYQLFSRVQDIWIQTAGPGNTLGQVLAHVLDIETELGTVASQVQSIYNDYQQRNQPVTLPSTPPAGYGGASASDVWSVDLDGNGLNAGIYLAWAGGYLWQQIKSGMSVVSYAPYFWLFLDYSGVNTQQWNYEAPTLELSAVTPGQTLLDALEAQNPGWTWFETSPGAGWYYAYNPSGGEYTWHCRLSEDTFAALLAALGYAGKKLPVSTNAPPVWPGLANVTLGSAVAISPPGQIVTGPMDGIIVSITGYPPYKGDFNFGGDVSVRNIGAIAFKSDNGQEELPQTLGFLSAVYCPKTMTRAAAVAVRAIPGVTGTITPWTITP